MTKKGNILVVDDNREILFSLELLFDNYFEKVTTISNAGMIASELKKHDYDVVVLDMNFTASVKSGNEGLYWLSQVLSHNPIISVVFITAFPGIELAVKAIKKGAFDFVEKPWNNNKLLTTILNAREMRRTKMQLDELKQKQALLQETSDIDEMITGNSVAFQKIISVLKKVANTDTNILILGDNGTGKEVIARKIHQMSDRSGNSFVKIDVGALPGSLFESELFGYEAGAFTDAKSPRPGRLELAAEGTLFLDEIGNLSPAHQSKLLSALQDKTFTRLGSNKPRKVDFRLICATNCNLSEAVKTGEFRQDLFYRINTVQIEIPPIRERKEDIPVFIQHFLNRYKKKYNKPQLVINDSLMRDFISFSWPGNIRQIDHVIENAVIMTDGDILTQNEIAVQFEEKPAKLSDDLPGYYQHEKELMEITLAHCEGNLSKAAAKLGIARTTLYRKIKKYDL
nr:sigma-54-dependent Fis family transcriptional regulator [Bacteroidota bacterium]